MNASGKPDLRIAFLSASRPATWTPGDFAERLNPQVATLLRDCTKGTVWITVLDYVGKYGAGAEEPVASIISVNVFDASHFQARPDTLRAGDTLSRGEGLMSSNRTFEARFQDDGNFVVYRIVDDLPTKATMSQDRGATRATMQPDGNFVIYSGDKPLAATDTKNTGGVRMTIQNDGNLVIYDGSGSPKWASQTSEFARRD